MEQTVTEKGQKFHAYGDGPYTVEGFFSASGILYDTLELAIKAAPNETLFLVKNEELGGSTDVNDSFLIF